MVDSDRREITRECVSSVLAYNGAVITHGFLRFGLKFQEIVRLEQEANFISRLHKGKLNIMPWPVIESEAFYTLFDQLKVSLERQPVTYPNAGIFIQVRMLEPSLETLILVLIDYQDADG